MELGRKQYECNGLDAILFYRATEKTDFNHCEPLFSPRMCHQIFGEKEIIVGYKKIIIRYFYAASTMHTYIDIKYESKFKNLEADEVLDAMKTWLPCDTFYNLDSFKEALDLQNHFRPFGCKVAEWNKTVIYKEQPATNEQFKAFHHRFESMLVYFIDAASRIDYNDPNWLVFTIYEVDVSRYEPVGYCSAYVFSTLNGMRPRISQFVVLPHKQRSGVGTKALHAIYKHLAYSMNMEVVGITVESPSEDFSRLRDYVELKLCMEKPLFQPLNMMNGWSEDFQKHASEELKLPPERIRMTFECLLYYYSSTYYRDTHEQMRETYNDFVTRRIEKKLKAEGVTKDMIASELNIEKKRLRERHEMLARKLHVGL